MGIRARVINMSQPIERNWVIAPLTQGMCVRGRLLGYLTSVVEGVDDEFISVKESSSRELIFGIEKAQNYLTNTSFIFIHFYFLYVHNLRFHLFI